MDTRVESLRAELTRLNDLYFNKGEQAVPDEVYDSLKRELAELEGDTDDPLSPLNQVGAPSNGGFDKVEHLSPMLSLKNVFDESELTDWVTDLPGAFHARLEYKFDGASLSLRYQNGKLQCATTRGDGHVGDDILENARHFQGVPDDIGPFPGLIEVRGECIVPHHFFEKACERRATQGRKVYANPRNMAAGLMRSHEGEALADMGIRFIVYDVIGYPNRGTPTSIPLENLGEDVLSKFYTVDPVWTGLSSSIDQIMECISQVEADRKNLDYDIDGLVLKLISAEVREVLGQRSTNPRWAVAYKFEAQTATSILEGVDVQVGRTGVLTPVAKIKPVRLCGVTISSVNLHNFEEIDRLGLRTLDTVVVSRRGDVIPKIESVIKELRTDEHGLIQTPTNCPSCDEPVQKRDDNGVELYCSNRVTCPAQVINRMIYFVSRSGIDVKHLGPAAVEALIAVGSLASFSSLFQLSESDFYAAGLGESMTEKILSSINQAKSQPFYKVLRAVGIPEVGDSTARALAAYYPSFEALGAASEEELQTIEDVGPAVAQAIVLAYTGNAADLLALDRVFKYIHDSVKRADKQDLKDLKVVVTGSQFHGKSRKDTEEEVISRGAKLTKSVSKNTALVFAGTNPGPEKIEQAKQLGFTEIDGVIWVNPKVIDRPVEVKEGLLIMPEAEIPF